MSKTRYLYKNDKSYQTTMAEQIAMSLLTILGLPLFLGGWFSDLDTIKSWVAFIGGGVMLAVRFIFMCDKWYHYMWMRKMERRRIRKEMQTASAPNRN